MEYEAIKAVRWSHLKHMRTSPKHYLHAVATPFEPTPAMQIGTAAHALVLEPDVWDQRVVCYEGRRQGNAWKEFQAEHDGKIILTRPEYDRAKGTGEAVLEHPEASRYLGLGAKESAIVWTDPATGLKCKGKIDCWGRFVTDLKCTEVVETRRFGSHAAKMAYHAQCAWYQWGLAENGIETEPEPIIVAAESKKPHDVIVYRLPEAVVDVGRELFRRLLDQLAECIERDEWHGVAPTEQLLDLPAWAYESDDEDMPALTMGGVVIGGI